MTRKVQVCRVVGVPFNTSAGYHRGSEAGGGGFESRYRPCLRLFKYSLTRSFFQAAKIRDFSTEIWGFLLSGIFFSKITPFPT